ncbi:MAG TPA: 3-hydroxyacyl-CoA dehydrogenase, partial [Gammaproteobacteria bacterium]|nr:3-hydroxyacyl-CoA dehydrogenase [Gammaproteobacteria bacterium]
MPATDTHPESASGDPSYQHWRVSRDIDDIAWLTFDRAGESTNTLHEPAIQELGDILTALAAKPPRGLVLRSGKASGFIAGADVREFDHFTQAADVTAKVREAHAVFATLESLSCPTVAAVEGFCLGGGLELALCCQYIIARDTEGTRIGLPEVNLGIYPGFGGTVRLTERLGATQAMTLMLTGRLLRARAARAMGVIDQCIGRHDSLRWHARKAVLQQRRAKRPGLLARFSHSPPARALLAPILTRKTQEKANPVHYPAPFRLIDNWRQYRGDRTAMFDAEARGIGELMVGQTATHLRRVYFLMERLKSLGKGDDDARIRRVHVIGAGVMGGDIAAWCVAQGLEVTLQDRELQYIEPALKRAGQLFRRRLKTPSAINAAKARLIADVAGDGVARADVVIEAIIEDVAAKQALYRDLEPRMQAH